MIRILFLLILVLAKPVWADKYEDWARDFIVIRERTEACFESAKTREVAMNCVGVATTACMNPQSDWPHPEPRDCRNEANVWERLYRLEIMVQFQMASALDEGDLLYDRGHYADRLDTAIRAEQAWQAYRRAFCRREALPLAERPYLEREKVNDWCFERLTAERIFYLRSDENWLQPYRP
jgi:hypothetical protein